MDLNDSLSIEIDLFGCTEAGPRPVPVASTPHAPAVDATASSSASPPGSLDLPLPALSQAQSDGVDLALQSGESAERLTCLRGLVLTRKDVHTLSPYEWLNDEVVNFMCLLVQAHSSKQATLERDRGGKRSCYIMSSFFYVKLLHDGCAQHARVARWTASIDIFVQVARTP